MNFKRQNREAVDVNLTPLIDIVFLLLIFFMVSTTFTKKITSALICRRQRQKRLKLSHRRLKY